jgi:CO/xanthine dehydrogenase Mo-binding subunit
MTANGELGMIDAVQRVTGRIPYTINVQRPNMLHARLLRSTSAHARLIKVDVARAREVPGVVAVVTGADIAARKDMNTHFGPVFRDRPVLAIDKVRFVGDPIAAVVAENIDAANEALELIEVEYAELPAVFSSDEAIADGAPLVHEGPPNTGETFADIIINTEAGTNVCNHFKLRKGDIEKGFAEADHIFEDTFTSPAVQHVALETHACVAEVTDGQITMWTTSQIPHMARSQVAEVFHTPLSNVRVIVSTLGGGYGSKCYPQIEPVTVALAKFTHRPVRLQMTREEEFLTITKHGMRITMKTGVKADGTIVARKSTCYFNTGAYADIGPRLIKNGGYGTGGPHNIDNVWVDSYAVYTNIVPAGAFRGYGISQAAWAYETQMDMIAERIGLDPSEFRMKNLLVDGDRVMTGEQVEDVHFRELLTTAAEKIGWDADEAPQRDGSKVRAKGLSCIIKGTVTPSTSTAAAKLNDDGSLNVLTSSVEMGQGLKTALAIIGGEVLGLPPSAVHISEVDTDVTPYDQQTSSSRGTFSGGGAVRLAVAEIREQLLALAAEQLEVAVDDLEIADGKVSVKGVPSKALDFKQIVRKSRSGNILGNGSFITQGGLDPETGQGIGSVHWHQAAGAAEVEVDLDTGKVDILRYHAGVYAGRIINPAQSQLQTEGNVAFGLGQALFEEMIYDSGQLQNGNLGDYMIASIEDMPDEISLDVLEHLEAHDVHGIGETSLPPVMPAVGNAIYRATGVRITDLPITPEKIKRALDERSRSNGSGAQSSRAEQGAVTA